jgi:hypothetical protein
MGDTSNWVAEGATGGDVAGKAGIPSTEVLLVVVWELGVG